MSDHGILPPGGVRWGCDDPTKPPDSGTVFDRECAACRAAFETYVAVFPEGEGTAPDVPGTPKRSAATTLAAWEHGYR